MALVDAGLFGHCPLVIVIMADAIRRRRRRTVKRCERGAAFPLTLNRREPSDYLESDRRVVCHARHGR